MSEAQEQQVVRKPSESDGSRPRYQGSKPAGSYGSRPSGGSGTGQGDKPAYRKKTTGVRFSKKKFCIFCVENVESVDYKDIKRLRKYVTERGKILPRRITGNCAYHQRQVTKAVKRSRTMALLPYRA